MIGVNFSKFLEFKMAKIVILVVFCSILQLSSQDLDKFALEEGKSAFTVPDNLALFFGK